MIGSRFSLRNKIFFINLIKKGYTCHQLGVGSIVVQLAQPYVLSSMRLLLWDCDDRSYTFDVSVSNDRKNWKLVVRRDELSRSWQYMEFEVF